MRKFLFSARYILFGLALLITLYKFGLTQGAQLAEHIAAFIVIVSVIVFIHEFGHYIVAKWSGVKIEVFSIGFGRELIGWNDKSGTRWKISALPLGGYVRMYGDISETSTQASTENMTAQEKTQTFYHKPLYKKAAIVVAGPLANFILTIAILTYFIATVGFPSFEPIVGQIVKDSPAETAGLKSDDRILSINGTKVGLFQDIQRIITLNVGTPVTLKVLRGEDELKVILTPKQIVDKDGLGESKRFIIGITSKKTRYEDVGLPRALWEATRQTYYMCAMNLEAIGQIIVGDRSASDSIRGPLSIAKLSGQAAEKGISTMIVFMANLSASLGLINLFPIPMLDGGHLLYYAIEAVQGKPLAKRFQDYGLRIGMAMIAMLMMFAILNDIRSLLLS